MEELEKKSRPKVESLFPSSETIDGDIATINFGPTQSPTV
jgi:hypothetical protein